MWTIDFETEAIGDNPIILKNTPAPCGVALHSDSTGVEYIPADKAQSVLERIWASNEPLLFHNAPYDLSVAERHYGLPMPEWERIHDTQYLVYLADPYAKTLSLKPSAERYLDLPPEEQDHLRDWIVANVPDATPKNFGAFISLAPFELVKPYAEGDVIRTWELYQLLSQEQPQEAYDRERRLMPMMVESTRHGVRVDLEALEEDLEFFEGAQKLCDDLISQRLNYDGDPDLLKGATLCNALESAGIVRPDEWILTEKSRQRSTAKDNIIKVIKDPDILALLQYKGVMATILQTFMRPWTAMAQVDGRLHPNWNQVRDTERRKGTRTGRLSCDNPNFQNVIKRHEVPHIPELPDLPYMRRYLLPEEGHVWLMRDFSGQELRIGAHYEDGELMKAYKENPRLDPHGRAQGMIKDQYGVDLQRKDVKITGFRIIYGGGAPAIAGALGLTVPEGAALKARYLGAMPGLKRLMDNVSARGRAGQHITTWGGRHYFAEGRDKAYKLTNYLIQGSAADQTKQCCADWYYEYRRPQDVFMATVHDEINISVPADEVKEGMEQLKLAMDQDFFDVPMASEGQTGPNWHEMEDYDDE